MPGPFHPRAASASVAVGLAASGGVEIPGLDTGCGSIRVVNTSTGVVHIAFGFTSAVAATTANQPFAPGVTEVMSKNGYDQATYFSVIGLVADGKVYITAGNGF